MRLERPFNPNSSARTRKALSEAIKFTVFTRSSRITARSRRLRKMDPLAPVVATVRFCGGELGQRAPGANPDVAARLGPKVAPPPKRRRRHRAGGRPGTV